MKYQKGDWVVFDKYPEDEAPVHERGLIGRILASEHRPDGMPPKSENWGVDLDEWNTTHLLTTETGRQTWIRECWLTRIPPLDTIPAIEQYLQDGATEPRCRCGDSDVYDGYAECPAHPLASEETP